jgi:hypothetical protein
MNTTSGVFSSLARLMTSPLFEIALALMRFDHVASVIVKADHRIM